MAEWDLNNDLSRVRARRKRDAVEAHVRGETRRLRRNWTIFLIIVTIVVAVCILAVTRQR